MNSLSTYALLVFALIVGGSLASQAGINSQLRIALNSPIQAAFISFLIGTIILGTISIFQNESWFTKESISALPWWAWLGGAFGAFNIAMSVFLAPKLGALVLAISIVCGQVIASIVLDHNGWLGYPKIELSITRICGAVLIVLGVILVARR
ncbi:DMT family transporter [Microbulbifer sp. GL-2]|uniref:DMT family transporter n=1 Tax=Microbulbifer sp. GL-2 TaxID=2591606 RepID=UPI00117E9E48|nr:DMT family transporter [Microbulbifer sp. GL-2]